MHCENKFCTISLIEFSTISEIDTLLAFTSKIKLIFDRTVTKLNFNNLLFKCTFSCLKSVFLLISLIISKIKIFYVNIKFNFIYKYIILHICFNLFHLKNMTFLDFFYKELLRLRSKILMYIIYYIYICIHSKLKIHKLYKLFILIISRIILYIFTIDYELLLCIINKKFIIIIIIIIIVLYEVYNIIQNDITIWFIIY